MYSVRRDARRRGVRLVSVKQAEKLVISLHGSEESMESVGFSITRKFPQLLAYQSINVRWLVDPRPSSRPDSLSETPNDKFLAWRPSVLHLYGPIPSLKIDSGVMDFESILKATWLEENCFKRDRGLIPRAYLGLQRGERFTSEACMHKIFCPFWLSNGLFSV